MNVIARLDEIMKKQGLNDYQLAKLSGLSPSTISNMRKRNTIPSIATLENICAAMHVTLAQFFTSEEDEYYPLTLNERIFFDYYVQLDDHQQHLMIELAINLKKKT